MQQQGSCGAGFEGLWALLTFPTYLYSLLEELVEISEPRHDVVGSRTRIHLYVPCVVAIFEHCCRRSPRGFYMYPSLRN